MRVRAVVKKVVPPLFVDAYRALRPRRPTWAGVYPGFSAVPAAETRRQEDAWLDASVDAAGYGAVVPDVLQEHGFLAILASILCKQNGWRLRILEVGGGLGVSYVQLLHTLTDCGELDYHIVELEWACREGGRRFAGDGRLHYHRTLPPDLPSIDIVHLTQALEYVEDYADLLTRLSTYRPQYLLLVGLHAGPFATYATGQLNMPGAVVPQWFFNLDEVVGILRACDYRLVFKGAEDSVVDQHNFPEAYRLPGGCPLVLLFARHGSRSSSADWSSARSGSR